MSTRRLPGRALLIACAAASLSACSGDTNYVRDGFVAAGVGAERRKAPDFVESSRPANIDYTPVGVAPPKRTAAMRGAAGAKAGEAEMDALRAANEARARDAKAAGAAVEAPKPVVVPPAAR